MALPDKQRRQARIFTKSAASSAQCAIATITARITRIYEEGRGRPMSSIARGQTHRGWNPPVRRCRRRKSWV